MSLYYNFTDYDGVTPAKFVGMQIISIYLPTTLEVLCGILLTTIGTVPLGTIWRLWLQCSLTRRSVA